MSAQNPAVEALGVAVAARVPVLLWGAPGTGKTSAIRAMAEAMGLPCETVIASIREPSDFAGLPIVVGDEVRFAPPAWARRLANPPATAMARAASRQRQHQQEADEASQRRLDMLSLLALGAGFQVRLSGHVVAAYAERLDEPDELGRNVRSVLTAALSGRLAPMAERWLGIDPDQVEASLHQEPGWGSVELTGRGAQRRLLVSLPPWWLARVWACGLALTGRHLVVAVERAGWPDAQVLALRAPGAEPVSLSAHASDGRPGTPDAPHWEI